jgi:hypothetical protein
MVDTPTRVFNTRGSVIISFYLVSAGPLLLLDLYCQESGLGTRRNRLQTFARLSRDFRETFARLSRGFGGVAQSETAVCLAT